MILGETSLTPTEFRVNNATSGDQLDLAIAMNRVTGEFVVTWTSAT